ncbi:MAG: TauD/TfdA family dioxygenase [Pseudomonadota bacterium]
MTSILPITETYAHPSAWDTSTIQSKDDIAVELNKQQIQVLLAVAERARRMDLKLESITREDFPLDEILQDLQHWLWEVQEGRSIILLRGLPMEQLSYEDCALIYWVIGSHFGSAQPQSIAKDLLGYVQNQSDTNRQARGYQNRAELSMHTDATDILGMMCLVPAKIGGLSGYASGPAIYNYLLENDPEVLEILCEGFYYPRFGPRKPNDPLVTDDKYPIFSLCEGYLSVSYLRAHIDMAFGGLGRPKTESEEHALTTFETLAKSPAFCLRFNMNPGEILFMNNYVLFHDRTEFEDDEDPEKHRLMLRLWLKSFKRRPLSHLASPYIPN